MKEISVVINARLGSTRVRHKLIRRFAGSSLIEIALAKLDQMSFFKHRFLAVAEDELATYADRYNNVEVLRRDPAAVTKGVNPLTTTFEHYLRVPTDYVFVFNPCLPCIEIATVKAAFDYFQTTDYNSYTAVIPTGDWIFGPDGMPLTNSDPNNATTNKNRQFLKGCHAFHIIQKKFFAENRILWRFVRDDPHLIVIPESQSADVDTEEEFYLAEKLYEAQRVRLDQR
jgi:CMP-N-acetylneuraminic acid synthetase